MKCECDNKRETEIDRDRETDKQTGRQAGKQTGGQTESGWRINIQPDRFKSIIKTER